MGSAQTPKRVLMEVQNNLQSTPRTPKIARHILPKDSVHIISPLSSPISPMANLKLLTKVASVFSEQAPPSQLQSEKYSRRLRSLSFICKKFLEIYRLDIPLGKSESISLVSLANRLGIKKRRVYDVINVVSSLNLAVKVCKDKYRWFGAQNLIASLSNLKAFALQNNFHTQLKDLMATEPELNWTLGKRQRSPTNETGDTQCLKVLELDRRMPFDHNRIGDLCQKFVMLFLVAEDGTSLSLLLLSKLILSSDIQYKTGVRRLYDVANALEALGLIVKSDDPSARRPSFVYNGPKVNSSGSTAGLHVECVSDNSFDAQDSELDCSQDTSIDHLLEIESSDQTPRGVPGPIVEPEDERPPAKKRLVFSEGSSSSKAANRIVLSPTNVTDKPASSDSPLLRDAKSVLLSSFSSRLLAEDEAAYYRAKISSTQQQPTFLILRSANKLTLRLK
uniref:Transcription factor E2F7 n=1 Tax=Lygus hesperus TaxID=30085 RepID=A0A146KPQ6_LYGHE